MRKKCTALLLVLLFSFMTMAQVTKAKTYTLDRNRKDIKMIEIGTYKPNKKGHIVITGVYCPAGYERLFDCSYIENKAVFKTDKKHFPGSANIIICYKKLKKIQDGKKKYERRRKDYVIVIK